LSTVLIGLLYVNVQKREFLTSDCVKSNHNSLGIELGDGASEDSVASAVQVNSVDDGTQVKTTEV